MNRGKHVARPSRPNSHDWRRGVAVFGAPLVLAGLTLGGSALATQSPPGCGPLGGLSGPVGGHSGPVGGWSAPLGGLSGPVGGLSGPVGGWSAPVGGLSGPVGGWSAPLGGLSGPVGGVSAPVACQSAPSDASSAPRADGLWADDLYGGSPVTARPTDTPRSPGGPPAAPADVALPTVVAPPAGPTPSLQPARPGAARFTGYPAAFRPGEAVVVHGLAQPGARLQLLAADGRRPLVPVRTQVADARGQFQFRILPRFTTRLVVRTLLPTGHADSAPVRVTSRPVVTAKAVARRGAVTFSGTRTPAYRHAAVTLVGTDDRGRRVLLGRGGTDDRGRWSVVVTASRSGRYVVTAETAPDALTGAARSVPMLLELRRR